MIVTCPDCDTSFQLDESRVPEKGIRVRCSRCKHAFHLAHPSASRSEAIDAVAAEAASSGSTSIPSVTQDLTSPPAAEPAPEESGSPMFDGDEINNEDDAEWEFNQDVPAAEAGASEPVPEEVAPPDPAAGSDLESAEMVESEAPVFADASDDDIGSGLDLASGDDGESLELDTGDDDHVAPDARSAPGAGVSSSTADESSGGTDFGTVDDFSSLMEDDDSQNEAEALDDQDGSDSLREQAAEQAGLYASAGQSDELGDPESWDFFDDESPSAPSASRPAATGGVALGRIGVTSASASSLGSRPGAAHDIDAGGFEGESRLHHVLESAGRLVGWTIVIVGLGLGLVSGLWNTAESFVAGERTTTLGSVEAVDMRAQWVDTARAGRLLVVTGGLRNVTRASTTLTGPIEIALLDRHGSPMATEPIAVGVALAERQIRELPVEILGRQRARAAHQLLTSSIPAGGLLPFQAVIFDPPNEGMRFEIRQAEGGRLSLPMPSMGSGADESVALDAELEAEADESAADAMAVAEGQVAPTTEANQPTPGMDAAEESKPGFDGMYGEDPGLGLQDL